MKSFLKALVGAGLVLLALANVATAQVVVLDQIPVPTPSTANATLNSEIYNQYVSVPGGALYQAILRGPGTAGPLTLTQTFVPGGGGSRTRYLPLTDGKLTTGLPLTATTGSGTSFGVARTAGTSLALVGTATSTSTTTNTVFFEFSLPDTYVAGANVPLIVNANYSGSGTVTAATTTITPTFYTETNGVEAAVTTSAAQQFTGTGATYTFTVTGTGLVPGQHVSVQLVMSATTSAGAITGQINSVAYQG